VIAEDCIPGHHGWWLIIPIQTMIRQYRACAVVPEFPDMLLTPLALPLGDHGQLLPWVALVSKEFGAIVERRKP
jgi:hypothetical protein